MASFGGELQDVEVKAIAALAADVLREAQEAAAPKPPAQAEAAERREGGEVTAAVVTQCKPVYPRSCRIDGEEGTVVLSVEIGADGRAKRVWVTASSGHRRLDEAAAEALRTATYLPAKRGGQPIASVKRIAVAFRLREADNDGDEGEN